MGTSVRVAPELCCTALVLVYRSWSFPLQK